jgi:hypothetical protein
MLLGNRSVKTFPLQQTDTTGEELLVAMFGFTYQYMHKWATAKTRNRKLNMWSREE